MWPAVGDIGDRINTATVGEAQAEVLFVIDLVRHFTFAQVGHHFVGHVARHTKSHAKAGAAGIEPEDQARMIGCSSMNVRIDAQAAPITIKAGADRFHMCKARSPHQRAITENPEIVHSSVIESCGHKRAYNDLVNVDFHR
jgi:hypothetical protein